MTLQIVHRGALSLAYVALLSATVVCAQTGSPAEAAELEQQGRNAEAAAAWRAYSAHHPAEAEPYAHVGQLEARQEHYPEAIAAYRKAMAIAPEMPGLQPNLGLVYFKSGDYRKALEMFGPMLKANPNDPKMTLLAGMSHYGLREYEAATPYLKRAADADAQNLTLQMTLAHSCLYARQYPCVLDAYHHIVALNPDSAEAHMLAGEALDEMKDPLGAQREFRAAIEANPREPEVHFGLGYLLWTKMQYPEAAEQFEAELDNSPSHTLAMLYLADTQMKLEQTAAAQTLLEKLVKLTPRSAMAHRDLGTLYADGGKNDAAVSELKEAIRLAPNDVGVHWRLGRLYRSMGKMTAAKAEFETTKKLNKTEDQRLVQLMSQKPDPKN